MPFSVVRFNQLEAGRSGSCCSISHHIYQFTIFKTYFKMSSAQRPLSWYFSTTLTNKSRLTFVDSSPKEGYFLLNRGNIKLNNKIADVWGLSFWRRLCHFGKPCFHARQPVDVNVNDRHPVNITAHFTSPSNIPDQARTFFLHSETK